MDTWTGKVHDGFTVRLKNLFSSGVISYSVNIEIIYDERFASDSTLKVKAYRGSKYI